MKRIKQVIIVAVMLVGIVSVATAQKYGHLNSANLLMQMPAAQDADKELASFQETKVKEIETIYKAWEAKALDFQKKMAEGTLAQIDAQKLQGELETERQSIITKESEVQQAVADKRNELLQPIVEKINQAIEDVGKEGSYTMIFDTSVFNAMLYVRDADDVMALVKAKLNLP